MVIYIAVVERPDHYCIDDLVLVVYYDRRWNLETSSSGTEEIQFKSHG